MRYNLNKHQLISRGNTTPDRNNYPMYYTAKLKLYVPNDLLLFPSREHTRPGPVLTPDGLHKYEIEQIIDSWPRGRGFQFLMCWKGYGPEDHKWLATQLGEDCEVLDHWYDSGGDSPGSTWYLPAGVQNFPWGLMVIPCNLSALMSRSCFY